MNRQTEITEAKQKYRKTKIAQFINAYEKKRKTNTVHRNTETQED